MHVGDVGLPRISFIPVFGNRKVANLRSNPCARHIRSSLVSVYPS